MGSEPRGQIGFISEFREEEKGEIESNIEWMIATVLSHETLFWAYVAIASIVFISTWVTCVSLSFLF